MKKLSSIDPFSLGRGALAPSERKTQYQQKQEQEKIEFYQYLVELCRIGEINTAKNLAQKTPQWGYIVSQNQVFTREDLE